MSYTLILTFAGLLLIAIGGRYFIHLPKNVWLLFLAQPLCMSSSSMVVFAGGLLATKIAPSPELATLPLTVMILGSAAGVIPASMLLRKLGRRKGTMLGLSLAMSGAALSAIAAMEADFSWLLVGAVLLGMSMAFVAQMRFAAIESVGKASDAPKAVSVLMVGGIFAAVLGPEIAAEAKDWINSPYGFAGSFVALAMMVLVAILIISRLDPIGIVTTGEHADARPLSQIIRQPIFIIAVTAGAIAYSVMSYVMTATPLSMHEVEHHSLLSTKWVVQSHIIAMYLPSLFSAFLIRHLGLNRLMLIGCLMYAAVVVAALSGQAVMHYWWAMVLLGVGWNFLFTAGTLILPQSYQPNEKFKVQAVNDFTIFFVQALASLSAGIILFSSGWNQLIYVAIPVILVMFAVSIWYLMLGRRDRVDAESAAR